jgi:hypothetical protein
MDFFLEALSTPAPLLLPLRRLSGCRPWGIAVFTGGAAPAAAMQLCPQASHLRAGTALLLAGPASECDQTSYNYAWARRQINNLYMR